MVLYEDNHLLVVDKSPGILVQGDRTGDETMLDLYKGYIKEKYNKPGAVYLHAAHRLDRPVSGCLMLIKTSKALSRMTKAWRDGQVLKMYHAMSASQSDIKGGLLTDYLKKDTSRNKSLIVKPSVKGAKKCKLEFSLSGAWKERYLYKIHPHTGRSHQIRVQLSAVSSPILGDLKYGGASIDNDRMICLHCSALYFEHPVKKEPIVVSSLPRSSDLWNDALEFILSDINIWEDKLMSLS